MKRLLTNKGLSDCLGDVCYWLLDDLGSLEKKR